MIYSEEAGWSQQTQAEQVQWMAAYEAFNEALTKSGVLRGKSRLQPSSTIILGGEDDPRRRSSGTAAQLTGLRHQRGWPRGMTLPGRTPQ